MRAGNLFACVNRAAYTKLIRGKEVAPLRLVERFASAWPALLVLISLTALSGCRPQDPNAAPTGDPAAEAAAKPAAVTTPEAEIAEPVTRSDEELAEGWISLFDGQTLFGWKHEDKADWRVEDGAIVVEQGDICLLVTTAQYSDYVLRLQFRCAPQTNSGVFLSTVMDPTEVTRDCYELNIAGADNPFPTGSLVGRKAVAEDLNRSDWQDYEVRVEQGHVVVQLDGRQVLEYTDPEPIARGYIGLQHNQGRVEFRDIELKPLGLQSLFNGANLEGWKTYPEMPSKFTVDAEKQVLNVMDGRGQLETEQLFGDFILQLECMTHAPQLNSGIFFRCIPGEQMNGYECQIHNGYREGDRTKPVDCGTGGFFRRQDARRVVADDLEWFHMTLVANGPHMAAWVNGCQVSDWTDTRDPDPNPRKGLRLESGTIMIQGHDPTTNIDFRNLRIAELRQP